MPLEKLLRAKAQRHTDTISDRQNAFLSEGQKIIDTAVAKFRKVDPKFYPMEKLSMARTPDKSITGYLSGAAFDIDEKEKVFDLLSEAARDPAIAKLQLAAAKSLAELKQDDGKKGNEIRKIRTAAALKIGVRDIYSAEVDDVVEGMADYNRLTQEREEAETAIENCKKSVDAMKSTPKVLPWIEAGASRKAIPLEAAIHNYFEAHPEAFKKLQASAELHRFAESFDRLAGIYFDEEESLTKKAESFSIEGANMRRAASLFRSGTTVDFAFAVGLRKDSDGSYFVAYLSPMIGKAKMEGTGVRLAFYESEDGDSNKMDTKKAVAAAARWLEKPRLEAEPMIYCPK